MQYPASPELRYGDKLRIRYYLSLTERGRKWPNGNVMACRCPFVGWRLQGNPDHNAGMAGHGGGEFVGYAGVWKQLPLASDSIVKPRCGGLGSRGAGCDGVR